jgi:hypothetical protein
MVANGSTNGTTSNGHGSELTSKERAEDYHEVRRINRSIVNRWMLKARDSQALEKALETLLEISEKKGASEFVRTLAAKALADGTVQIASLCQRSDEFEDKVLRLDRGDPTERTVYEVEMPETRIR